MRLRREGSSSTAAVDSPLAALGRSAELKKATGQQSYAYATTAISSFSLDVGGARTYGRNVFGTTLASSRQGAEESAQIQYILDWTNGVGVGWSGAYRKQQSSR
jgi:hypothetical protein